MGYRLQMAAEIHDWLAELDGADPPTAELVAQALAALATEGDRLGPPLVTAVPARLRPDELLPQLDRRYQSWLETLQTVRRRTADGAALTRSLRRQLAELESSPEAGDRAAGLRDQLAAATAAGERLTATSQQEQSRADAFRTRKEVLKAAYTVARAEQLIDLAQGRETEAADRLDEVTGQIEQEVGWEPPAEGLMELRPGGPVGVIILFAVEPPGTALLIAVLEDHDAVHDHYREAVHLASEVLRDTRDTGASQEPDPSARTYCDAPSFLADLFPDRVEHLRAGATALVAAHRTRTLAEQRVRLGLTQAQVAARMGVRQERVSAIERAEPGATEVRTLAGYVEALGGRLDLVADFGSERVPLR